MSRQFRLNPTITPPLLSLIHYDKKEVLAEDLAKNEVSIDLIIVKYQNPLIKMQEEFTTMNSKVSCRGRVEI